MWAANVNSVLGKLLVSSGDTVKICNYLFDEVYK